MLQLDLTSMGPLKTLPYLVMFLMSNAGGWAGDALILQHHKSVAAARKTVNTIGKVVVCGRRRGGCQSVRESSTQMGLATSQTLPISH